MIQISTLFELIHIPTEAEFCIYTKDYYIDRAGKIFEKAPSTDVCEYGDLYIDTFATQYVFRRVYSAYDYCAQILELLRKWNGVGSISIRLETLNKVTPFRAEGGFEIIQKYLPANLNAERIGVDGTNKV